MLLTRAATGKIGSYITPPGRGAGEFHVRRLLPAWSRIKITTEQKQLHRRCCCRCHRTLTRLSRPPTTVTVITNPPATPLFAKAPSPIHRAIATAATRMSRHPDFKTVEASRPDWTTSTRFRYTKTADPNWTPGSGANHLDTTSSPGPAGHVAIDPYEPGRPPVFNYKLLISAITPRPIGFVSTRSGPKSSTSTTTATPSSGSAEGEGETFNLAPFSYFNVVNTDPPLFALGIASPLSAPKDTLRHLVANGECTVNMISEHFVEAANATSVDAPPGCSEWVVSGLTPVHDCVAVATPRAREAVFAVECRVESIREFESRAVPGKKSGCMVLLEGLRFWVREDALNDEHNAVAPEILRPISRLGGISYGRTMEAIELPRPVFERDVGMETYERLVKERKTATAEVANGAAE
ncbi:hypothetical protein GGR51DRAFT_511022 [Nemania sp. FL0031]|nr:hypothetical protein GGR51DRAFT_511022 [Nemania sp. FL0031]